MNIMKTMNTTKRIGSIITAFVMAFTVFGCTSLSFAAEEEPETEATTVSVPADAADAAATEETTDSNENTDPEEITNLDGMSGSDEMTGSDENIAPDENADPDETQTDDSTVETMGETGLAAPATKAPVAGYRTVTLSWNAAAPEKKGEISYNIYDSNKKLIKSNLKTLTVSITGLSPRSASYTYYITAVEKTAEGTKESKTKAFPEATTKDFSTLKLTGLAADPGYKAVLLEWNRVDGATGYKIYWRKGGERGNIDAKGKCSDGRNLKTVRSKKTRKYEVVSKPGKYELLTTINDPGKGKKITFDKRGLKIMNHTYVYFYQFMVVPYFKDDIGEIVSANVNNKWSDSAVNAASSARCQSQPEINVIKQNTVLPFYVLESAKTNKPIYNTHKQSDSKKAGSFTKGHKFICYDKSAGRVKFYEKENVSDPNKTYWFAQKNAHPIQGYYLNNGSKKNMKRKDYATGYSKKTVLDYVNHSGLGSQTGYLVWVSKYAQHVYIFKGKKGNWKLINGGKNVKPNVKKGSWSNLCSSGSIGVQSRNGRYTIYAKQYKAYAGAYDYYCLSKLHTAVRLHTVLYKPGASFSSKRYYNSVLGSPTSHGCIRMKPSAAKYIYEKIPTRTRSLVY